MKLFKKICFILTLLFTLPALGQNIQITGTIRSSGKLIPGVTVIVKGANSGTQTDDNGRFTISVPNQNSILVFSSIGYEKVELPVKGKNIIDVNLTAIAKGLDEVVVVGYGSVKKGDLTGAVSSVSAKDIEGQSVVSIEQALQGRVPGMQVTQSDAAPDGGISVVIRGSNSLIGGTEPLYVIDGIPISGGNKRVKGPQDNFGPTGDLQNMSQAPNMLSFLNPNDIASIVVLKDASSTAIYGSRGSNGVVLITTKKGNRNRTTVNFSSSVDVSNIYRKMPLLSGPEYAEAQNLNYIISNYFQGQAYEDIIRNVPYPGTYNNQGAYTPSPTDYKNGNAAWTDWQDVVFRTGISQKNSLGISGGSDKARYYVGAAYDDIKGTIIGSEFKRYSLNSNFDANLSNRVTLSNSFIVSSTKSDRAQTGDIHAGDQRGIISAAQAYSPLSLIGQVWYNDFNGILKGSDDPYTLATKFKDQENVINILENLSLKWNILKGLDVKVSGGAQYVNDERNMYYPITTQRGYDMGSGAAFAGKNESMYFINENTATYHTELHKQTFDFLLGFTQESTTYQNSSNTVSGFLNDLTQDYNLGNSSSYSQPSSDYEVNTLRSFLGRASYNYDERYFFDASLRADGSSNFTKENRWGYFPSMAFAWRVNKEPFFKINKISDLKLRLSYGVTGNQGVSPYQTGIRLAPVTSPFGNALYIGLQNDNLGNPDLKWEQTAQYNLGLDLGLFKQRLTLTGNIYLKKTTDLLQDVLLSANTGYQTQTRNLGSLQNKGIELAINGTIIEKKNFKWDMGFNYFNDINLVTSLGGLDEYPGGYTLWWDWRPYVIKVGQPLGVLYGYKILKVMKTQVDLDNAAVDNPNVSLGEYDFVKDPATGRMQLMKIGNTNPKFSFGFTNNFTLKQWSLAILLAGSLGQDIFNLNVRPLFENSQTYRSYYEKAWVPEIKDSNGNVVIKDNGGTLPVYESISGRNYNIPNDGMIENGSWVKLRNVTLSYTLITQKINWLKNIKLYVSGSNLFSIDSYSGLDPEASVYGQDPTRRGTAYGEYPMARTFTFGFNASF